MSKFELSADNYYSPEANMAYWSASAVKSMLNCPAAALAEMRGEYTHPQNTALLVGSYVDAHFEGTLDLFKAKHPEIFKRDGSLKAEFSKADEMINRAEQEPVFMEFMEGEKQHIQTGTIFGIPFKAKYDVYQPGKRIVDLKTAKDMEPTYVPGQGKVTFAEAWNWPLQMAIYQELEGNKLPCYLAVVTKQDPPDIDVVQIPQETLDAELALLEEKLFFFNAVKIGAVAAPRCGHCAYCRATKKLDGPKSLDDFNYLEETK